MDIFLEWLSKYSLPVVALISTGALFLYLIKFVTERALDNRFKQYETEVTLRLERRSRFEEKLQLDQYLLVTELFNKINRTATDLNRHRQGVKVDGLFVGDDIVPLTQVFEDLSAKRYLLGSRFHDVLRRHCELVLKIANTKKRDEFRLVETSYLHLINEFNQIASEEFGIEGIQRRIN